jgi:hypothetical protein
MPYDVRIGQTQPLDLQPHRGAARLQPLQARGSAGALATMFLTGAAVSVSLGVFGRLHAPAAATLTVPGLSGTTEVKVWASSLAGLLAVVQLGSALAMFGRLPVRPPGWTGAVHRWSGRLAFLAAAPVAMHCLYTLGWRAHDERVLMHSVMGCLFFGAFAAKMLGLSRRGLPGWVLPLLGSLVFTALVLGWLTSALWFFSTSGVHF